MSSKNSPETCLVYITVVFVDGPRVCVRVTAKSKVNQIVNGEANFKSSALYLIITDVTVLHYYISIAWKWCESSNTSSGELYHLFIDRKRYNNNFGIINNVYNYLHYIKSLSVCLSACASVSLSLSLSLSLSD